MTYLLFVSQKKTFRKVFELTVDVSQQNTFRNEFDHAHTHTRTHKHKHTHYLSPFYKIKSFRSDLSFVKYSICPGDNQESTVVWDTFLGANWNLLPGKDGQSDFVTSQMKFIETNHYVFSCTKTNLHGVRVFYQNNPSYREAIAEYSYSYNFCNFISQSEDRDDADAADADSDIAEMLN